MIFTTGTKNSSTSQGDSCTERRRLSVRFTPTAMKGRASASNARYSPSPSVVGIFGQR